MKSTFEEKNVILTFVKKLARSEKDRNKAAAISQLLLTTLRVFIYLFILTYLLLMVQPVR